MKTVIIRPEEGMNKKGTIQDGQPSHQSGLTMLLCPSHRQPLVPGHWAAQEHGKGAQLKMAVIVEVQKSPSLGNCQILSRRQKQGPEKWSHLSQVNLNKIMDLKKNLIKMHHSWWLKRTPNKQFALQQIFKSLGFPLNGPKTVEHGGSPETNKAKLVS